MAEIPRHSRESTSTSSIIRASPNHVEPAAKPRQDLGISTLFPCPAFPPGTGPVKREVYNLGGLGPPTSLTPFLANLTAKNVTMRGLVPYATAWGRASQEVLEDSVPCVPFSCPSDTVPASVTPGGQPCHADPEPRPAKKPQRPGPAFHAQKPASKKVKNIICFDLILLTPYTNIHFRVRSQTTRKPVSSDLKCGSAELRSEK